jgi:hypothetical protein
LDARLTTLLCKKIIVAKPKEVKTGCNPTESSREAYGSKRTGLPKLLLLLLMMIMMMMIKNGL